MLSVFCWFLDCRNVAAVDNKFASGDRRSSVGNQERNQFCDLIRSAGAAEWNPAQRVHQTLPRGSRVSSGFRRQPLDQCFGGLGLGESGGDTVDADPAWRDFLRQSLL